MSQDSLRKNIDELSGFEEDGEEYEVSQESATASGTSTSIEQQSMDIERSAKKTFIVAILILLVGSAATIGFMYQGITNAKRDQAERFEKRASDLSKEIDSSWRDYEAAALWIHESTLNWREEGFTRKDFRVLYEYIASGGLEFYAAELVPRVEHEEREAMEAEAYQYYANHPEINHTYQGFMGQEPCLDDPDSLCFRPRSVQPFYYPIHFFEPQTEHTAYHYDLYSPPWEMPTIQKALDTWEPQLTGRFVLVQNDESAGYSVVLYHPGIPLSNATGVHQQQPRDLSNFVIQIRSLLKRATKFQSRNLGAYLYDITLSEEDGSPPEFLTGLEILLSEDGEKTLNIFPEIEYEALKATDPYLLYEERIEVGGRVWEVVVIPVDSTYKPNMIYIGISGALIFIASFFLAVWIVQNTRRSIQMHRVMTKAAAEAAIVSNLFPESVLKRMLADATAKNNKVGVSRKQDVFMNNNIGNQLCEARLNDYLTSEGVFGSRPIAELHPYTTIMFADLVGFTAWSSMRDPSQVFTLLELLFNSFDTIAKRRRVFKVETVGDCYVAVAGLPQPRDDHAVCMARFSTDCLHRALKLFKALETTLGPDTGELGLRVGLHSGQVTAGVLRGDKGRFQLFGDTMNTTSRMESTGVKNKIQISQETAELLKDGGREKWLVPREDTVTVKGKGLLRTYFLSIKAGSRTSTCSNTDSSETSDAGPQDLTKTAVTESDKTKRLVEWNVQILANMLRKIVARRQALSKQTKTEAVDSSVRPKDGTMVLDEVKEVIHLPSFDEKAFKKQVDPDSIELDPEVHRQLSVLMTTIASMYHSNPFHNFEHASHVTMSVVKMMARILEPQGSKDDDGNGDQKPQNDHSLGIQSDPLTQFACAFSALIHDLDHQGVPNATLVREENPLAHKYKGKSVAEQNSVDLAWDVLMDPKYEQLRNCICCNQEEFMRFRSLVVNSVMATDIMDKELGAARKARWNKAFAEDSDSGHLDEDPKDAVDRKATIVIEHLIQASDVAHTMQHWHIYIKWNEKLFMEMYRAYKAGRLEKDPSIGWHQGEMGFFDFYIIPLAKKLFKCGVFGVSSDEYLNYALINRKEWEQKGSEMVEKYLEKYRIMYENGDFTKMYESEDYSSMFDC